MSEQRIQPVAGSSNKSSTSASGSRAEMLERCCEVLAERRHDDLGRRVLHGAIVDMCESARNDGLPPERLLVEIKRALIESPAQRHFTLDQAHDARMRFITLAIDAYYADAGQ
jgi:hypothetical protein